MPNSAWPTRPIDVAGIGLVDGLAVPAEELVGAGEADLLAGARVGARSCRASNLPEQMRTKAMRSRCRGSMFAWILKTNPEKPGSVGCDHPPARPCAGRGGGGVLEEGIEQELHAEVVDGAAEEDRRQFAREDRCVRRTSAPAPSSISSSSTTCGVGLGAQSARATTGRTGRGRRRARGTAPPAVRSKKCTCLPWRSKTPGTPARCRAASSSA